MMKDLAFGAALRGVVSNRLLLRWLKAVVVSGEEKASLGRRAGIGKASAGESSVTCRNLWDGIGTGAGIRFRDESGRWSAYWPGGARHTGGASPACRVRAEQEKACPGAVRLTGRA
jgi:hypothetical protein